tara:strand:- start:1599 stop:2288 length:690 start_codon:yes stop_codon:yes gene_type:complete
MTQKLTILLDLDGTLVDTAPDLMNAHNYVMKKFGYETKSTDDIRKMIGQGAKSLIGRSVWGQAKKELKKIKDKNITEQMVKDFIKYYGENILKESELIEGVEDFLNWSKKNQISLAVCTNKPERLAVDLLKKIKIYDYFEYVAGSDTFDYCKPDPRHLTNIVEILNGDLRKSIMVGDSETDADTATNANVPFILLENGYTERMPNEIKHNHLVKNFINIEMIIEKYLND